MEKEKITMCPCNGMSPYGLIARAACSDIVEETPNTISVCITATSADKEGFKDIIKKYPIFAVNGCEHSCADKILNSKGVKVSKTMNVMTPLQEKGLQPGGVARLGESGEECVLEIKKIIKDRVE